MDSTLHTKKYKKSKKNKDKKNDVTMNEITESSVIHTSIEHKEKKRKRKDKDEQKNEISVNQIVSSSGSDESVKSKKKKKVETEAPQEMNTANFSNGKSEKKDRKQKKKKKDKSEGAADSNGSSHTSMGSTSGGNYVLHPDVVAMSRDSVAAYRREVDMVVTPEEASEQYKPITEFSQLYPSLGNHCPEVKQYIEAKKFKKPSPIQSQCWPILLSGKDAIGIAATGSGKTLAFVIPALLALAKEGPASLSRKGVPRPRMLILAPTRELAMQSHNVVIEIGSAHCVCVYGGVSKHTQKNELRANGGVDVVVATPGRLEDLIDDNSLTLEDIRYLVLDEADRMLDDGFEPAIRRIIGKCPAANAKAGVGRQTVMFSATWPEEIRALADTFLSNAAIRVTVGGDELSANHRVTQIVECIDARMKDRRLMELLAKYHKSRKNRCLIFVLYKREAVTLQNTLEGRGYSVTAIHGDKNQHDRTSALEEFKSGRIPLLIATDVAARGLDIPQVEYVLNYSFPLTVEDYVHRIGRTGRGGASGISHTFFTDFDKGLAGGLVGVLQDANQEVPKEIYQYPLVTKKKQSKLYGDFGPKADLIGKKATKIVFDT